MLSSKKLGIIFCQACKDQMRQVYLSLLYLFQGGLVVNAGDTDRDWLFEANIFTEPPQDASVDVSRLLALASFNQVHQLLMLSTIIQSTAGNLPDHGGAEQTMGPQTQKLAGQG